MFSPNMLRLFTLLCLLQVQNISAQVLLDANGPGNTYSLITSVLAPGHNPIEVPDCNHEAFGDHIDEIFDDELKANVFRFHIHTAPDNDRCINFDRQRNEIKSYDKSPDNLLGVEGEKVIYKWKFKLADGFQSSPNFTHLHQLKSVGGALASIPMYTLTTRKGNPDKLELRYAETDKQVTLQKTDISPFIGSWLEVTETIKYGLSGTYELVIKKVSDDSILFEYSNDQIINWREEAEFVRPKWGIYRSLLNVQDLRDESVLFANFSIEEMLTVASEDLTTDQNQLTIYPNPSQNIISINNISRKSQQVRLFNLDGKILIEKNIESESDISIDVSPLSNGAYILQIIGKQGTKSEMVIVSH